MVRKMSCIAGLLARIVLELVLLADLLAQRAVLAPQRLALLGLAQREHDLLGLEGLLDVVVRARLDRLEREIDVAVRAHHDDGGVVALGLERREQIEPAHLGHAHVGEDDVGPERLDQRERLLPAVGRLDLVALALQSVRSTSRRFSSSSTTSTRRICAKFTTPTSPTSQIVTRSQQLNAWNQ